MLKKLLRFPFYAFMLGMLPITVLWNFNKTQVYPRDVWLSVGLSALFTVLIWILFRLILRTDERAGFAASLFFLLFFSYGHVYNLVKADGLFGIEIGFLKLAVVYAIAFVAFLLLIIFVKRLPRGSAEWLNLILGLLLVFNIVQILVFEAQSARVHTSAGSETAPVTPAADVPAALPDIYYIILDSYSRQDVLLEQMGYDNSAFIAALRERGFYVADCANANYAGTVASITSTLNYTYLESASQNESDTVLSMKDSRIRSDLAEYGYLFVTAKGFSSEDDVNNSDIYLNYLKDAGIKDTITRTQFTRMYFETTALRVVFEFYYMDPVKYNILPQWLFVSDSDDKVLGYASFWYNQTRYVFDQLETFPGREGNYLIYAHVNIPHQPFVFDANGNFAYTYNPTDAEGMVQPYLDQISYANTRVLELVEVLINESSVPPIIIIQGDHGAHVITTGIEKHKILNAYFVPESMSMDLYETITPVNTFRLILRDVFGQEIDLLPDTLFVKITDDLEPIPSACTNH